MNYLRHIVYLSLSFMIVAAAQSCDKEQIKTRITLPPEETAIFSTSDSTLQSTFDWAKGMALSYAHNSNDPVGAWYEAALPQREAFCMRDVAHQTTGGQILGLTEHNKNMLMKFAENISQSKDWCTYWEINRYNQPAPADYASDSAFWYNLNANFDIIHACLKMYEWTNDKDYLSDSTFTNFYTRSINEYADHWALSPDSVMNRRAHMNIPADYNPSYSFHTCRGLPSYVENFAGLTVGIDLLAALYAGHNAYAKISELNDDASSAKLNAQKALAYRAIIDSCWWDDQNARYNTFWTADKKFFRGEGIPLVLWFGAIDNPERIKASVDDILRQDWNVENLSAFPSILYGLGYNEEAYKYLTALPTKPRSNYPEVSFGAIEGIVTGAMGLKPSASDMSIGSLSRVIDHTTKISNVPVFDGYITLSHTGTEASEIENNTTTDLIWNASFIGNHKTVKSDGKSYPTNVTTDIYGNSISTAQLKLPAGKKLSATIK